MVTSINVRHIVLDIPCIISIDCMDCLLTPPFQFNKITTMTAGKYVVTLFKARGWTSIISSNLGSRALTMHSSG